MCKPSDGRRASEERRTHRPLSSDGLGGNTVVPPQPGGNTVTAATRTHRPGAAEIVTRLALCHFRQNKAFSAGYRCLTAGDSRTERFKGSIS
ncbi:hypothetical protein E2C01_064276 [Portunus trituberculatus]|uniref:Uncharacterized protein n=1 Tax=Portunus trituberculatus TaxID=210409 RepID=A0A5B7HB98_PORTR|nr:hypothetical protein [Portunus trituberculatus]